MYTINGLEDYSNKCKYNLRQSKKLREILYLSVLSLHQNTVKKFTAAFEALEPKQQVSQRIVANWSNEDRENNFEKGNKIITYQRPWRQTRIF